MKRNHILYTAFLNKLIVRGDSILVALSGGSDSVTLLHALHSISNELNLTLYAAHINHSIRIDADEDELFCKKLCNDLKITFFSKKFDVVKIAKQKHISEEECGREIRYEYFDKLCKEYNILKIATAHHANDSAESILHHFLRGSGLRGLIGISPYQKNIIRPLVYHTKKEIEEYINTNSLSYCTDSTNSETEYSRNFLRLEIIPKIEKGLGINIIKTLTRNGATIAIENEFIEQVANQAYESCVNENTINIKEFNKYHRAIGRRVIRKLLINNYNTTVNIYDVYVSDIEDLIKKHSTGKHINLPGGYIAKIDHYNMTITRYNNID